MGKEQSLQHMVLGQTDIHIQKNEVGLSPRLIDKTITTTKSQSQMDQQQDLT